MKLKYSILLNVFFIALIFCNTAFAEVPSKILILPFTIHAEKDLSFLRNGIQDMLTSRLTLEGEIQPLSKEIVQKASEGLKDINESLVISLGKKFKADYVIYGSLTVFGESISTDAKLFNIKKKKNSLLFNESGKNNGDVINHINQFALQVIEKISGPQSAPLKVESRPKKRAEESRQHPESLWKDRKAAEKRLPYESEEEADRLGDIWKSRNFKTEIKGISIGDADGDGNNETAFMDGKKIYIYRYTDDRFIKIEEIEGNVHDEVLNVDIADINKNGIEEIFVTSLNNNNNVLKSFVLEWNGKRFSRIVENARWYYRVIDVPGRGKVLMGQKRSMNRVFFSGVDELIWSNNEYIPSSPQPLPKNINVYGFNYGDIMNKGRDSAVVFTKRKYLNVLDHEGKKEWESAEPFSDSAVFLEFTSDSSASMGDYKEMDRLYLPQRILIADLDKDGKKELIAARNKDAAGRLFARLRVYKGGHIECLAWDEFGLNLKWKTREISGHISDYVIGDINNDGENELVFSVIKKISSVIGKAKSFIASQKINP